MLEQMASLDGRTSKGLQSIHRNTRALAQLVDDLLDVSRMISGKMRLDLAPMDLGDVVDAAVETILPAASAKDIGIRVAVDPASRTMTGDATRLQQTVWNLLSNAVKFTAAGGRVEVRTRLDDGQIELTVTDSGIGIDAAFLPYVFDRFRQADASSTRAQSGLGLGLAIVRHLVELHGGSVRAESDGRDAGTRFVVRLPHRHVPLTARDARSPASVSATPAATDGPRFDGLRILIVDDDRESCEMMLEALRRYGASVQCALSATEATATLLEFRPDLVLSDIAMPGRDGYEVLREVRQAETALGRRVPVAAVSAYAHVEDRQRAIAPASIDISPSPSIPRHLRLRSRHSWPSKPPTRRSALIRRPAGSGAVGIWPLSSVRIWSLSFETTRWSLVVAAGGDDSSAARAALATLCETYWYPLYAYVRRRGDDADDARDLTQGFLTSLLERRDFENLRPERGRFRAFLLASLQHFLANDAARRRTQKRGGGVIAAAARVRRRRRTLPFEPAEPATPETLYERRWALTVIERVLGAAAAGMGGRRARSRVRRAEGVPARRRRRRRLRGDRRHGSARAKAR